MSRIKFDIITIFPKIFDSYFNESIIKRAKEKKLIEISAHNIRDYSVNRHNKVDDKPYGGGAGMIMSAEPILKCAEAVLKKAKKPVKIILLSAKGKMFNQRMAYNLSKRYKNIILIAGRYEGIDERVKLALKAEEISIGPYVLTDGEVPAMAIVSAVTRLVPNVINWDSLLDESYFRKVIKKEAKGKGKELEYPHYTRPEVLEWKNKKYKVPTVLFSGDHKKIEVWRNKLRKNHF